MKEAKMGRIQELLNGIGQFRRSVEKALTTKRDRNAWIAEAATQAASIRSLLADSTLKSDLDQLLTVLHRELTDEAVARNASRVLAADFREFVKAEARLHELTQVRQRVYDEVVDEVSPWIRSSIRPDFPKTSGEFALEFEQMYMAFLKTISTAPSLPRRMSKEIKNDFLWRFWRYTIGTLITVANIYASYQQPSFSGMGSVSVTVGAWYFGSGKGGPKKPPRDASSQLSELEQDVNVSN